MVAGRRFELHRDRDISGVSGLGVVAEGVRFEQPHVLEWPDGQRTELPVGWCRVVWRGPSSSTVLWRRVEDLVAVNGHGGATRVVWVDEQPDVGRDQASAVRSLHDTAGETGQDL